MDRPPELDLGDAHPPVRAAHVAPESAGDLRECIRLAGELGREIRALTTSIRNGSPPPKVDK